MAKCLKGHATIELTDVKTGKKEIYKHHNLITNAPQEVLTYFSKYYDYNILNRGFLPIVEKLMGGIYLFDSSLQESAQNTQFPALSAAKLTGYAGNSTSDGNDTKRGDFNISESGAIENGYKFVWDFGTDDANGEIASLALGHSVAGYHGYNINYEAAWAASATNASNSDANYKGIGAGQDTSRYGNYKAEFQNIVSFENDILTTVQKTSTANIDVKKYKIQSDNVGLFDTLFTVNLISEEHIAITETVMTEFPEFFDGGDGFYYGIVVITNNTANSVIKICKIQKDNLQYTGAQQYNLGFGAWAINRNSLGLCAISNGYIFMFGYKNLTRNTLNQIDVYKVSLNNPTEHELVCTSEYFYAQNNSGYGANITKLTNGNILANNALIDVNGDYELLDSGKKEGGYFYSSNYIHIITSEKLIFERWDVRTSSFGSDSQQASVVPNLWYLATINNLDAPVTKTAAKTMKITYTLTYAEETE